MDEIEGSSLQAVIGANVQRIRLDAGLTVDDVVRVARACGLRWENARVLELQAGKLAVSASLLLTVAHVLGTAAGRRITLADLLDAETDVALTPTLTVTPAAVARVAGGGPAPFRTAEMPGSGPVGARAASSLMRAARIVSVGGDYDATAASAGLADERAAARAGLSLDEWLSWAHKTWGTSLTAERDRRAATSDKTRRGHVTRQLEAEIVEAIAGEAQPS